MNAKVARLVVAALVLSAVGCSSDERANEAPGAELTRSGTQKAHVEATVLANGGFEDGTAAWSVFGTPGTMTTARTGTKAARVTNTNVLTQRIPVVAGRAYLLKQWMRGEEGGEVGRVQVNWHKGDTNNTFISVDWLKPTVTTEYRQYRLVVTAPPEAAWAEVYASSDSPTNWVYVDDLVFAEAGHLRHQAYWGVENKDEHHIGDAAVTQASDLVYLNMASFLPAWPQACADVEGFSGMRAPLEAARSNGLRAIVDLSEIFYRCNSAGTRFATAQVEWRDKVGRYATAIQGLEDVVFAYTFDEPDGACTAEDGCYFNFERVERAVATIKEQPSLSRTQVMVTYIFSFPQTLPNNIDIVGVDPYAESPGRFDFEEHFVVRMGNARVATRKPLFVIGKSFGVKQILQQRTPPDRLIEIFSPVGSEPWYYEGASKDPQVIGLGWFTYLNGHDAFSVWDGAISSPSTLAAHAHMAADIFGDNLVKNAGFESGEVGWERSGSGAIQTRGTSPILDGSFEASFALWYWQGVPQRRAVPKPGLGAMAAYVDGDNSYWQTVAVDPGHPYQLRQWMRGALGCESGQAKISWLRSDGSESSSVMLQPNTSTEYSQLEMSVVSPSDASHAVIHVAGQTPGEFVYIDGVELLPHPGAVLTGDNSARGDALNGYVQRIAVVEGQVFSQAQWMRSEGTQARGRVQVNWYDKDNHFLSANIKRVDLTATWAHYDQEVTAPPGATSAELYVSSDAAGDFVFVDDMAFVRRK